MDPQGTRSPQVEIPATERPSRGGTPAVAAIAVVVYLLLVDVTIETFWFGATVRWWVLGIVTVFLAGLLVAWRAAPIVWTRMTPAVLATSGACVLFGLIAATAWLPGGLANGMRLVGQPTSVVLTLLTACAVVLAGVAALRMRAVPLWARMTLMGLAAYACAGFAVGLLRSTPYQALFHGSGFWSRLPVWLQGPRLGAFVVLPLGAIALALTWLTRRGEALASMSRLQPGALLLAAFAASLAAVSATGGANPPNPRNLAHGTVDLTDRSSLSADMPRPTAQGSTLTVASGETARLIAAYQDVARNVDRSAFDVKARAAVLGHDRLASFAFVRDEIANEIYPGVLRGAAGTLSAGAGNDLDKSLLLGTLLAETKHAVRYARCMLEPQDAERRVAAMFSEPAAARIRETDVGPVLKAALLRTGYSEARASEVMDARDGLRQWLEGASFETARADLGVLREALDRAGLRPLIGPPDPAVVQEARAHYWVQTDQGGSWEDLDASAAGAQPGTAPCVAAETFAELPPGLFQTLTISVRNESLADQALTSENVLTQRYRVSDLYGRVITFVNLGSTTPKAQPARAPGQFLPILLTGETLIAGKEYSPSPTSPPAPASMFGPALDGGGSTGGTALVAQWVDFTLEAPGRRSSFSRALTDFVDPRERADGKILTRPNPAAVVASLAQGGAIAVSAGFIQPAAAVETAFAKLDGQAAGRLIDAVRGAKPTDDQNLDLSRVWNQLLEARALTYAFAAERALTKLSLTVGPHVRLIRDQPMVTIVNMALGPSRDRKGVVAEMSVDLRHDAVRVIVDSPANAEQGFWANVLRGLVDGALEHHIPAASTRSGQEPTSRTSQFDTSLALQLARSQGIEVRAGAGPAAGQLLQGDLAEHGGRRLALEITAGDAVVTPVRPVLFQNEQRLGLWSVNMRTGDLLALLDTGLRGQTERATLEARLVVFAEAIRECVAAGANMPHCRMLLEAWKMTAQALADEVSIYPWSTVINWPVEVIRFF
jgi:hypothetical protein